MIDRGTKPIWRNLGEIWSLTSFESSDILRYAMPRITLESQRGVAILGMAALIFLLCACLLSVAFELGTHYVYTYALLAALALHVYFSTRSQLQLNGLHLLAMALLVICGSALVLVAQQSGKLDVMLFASVAALFMLVPVVPWGLREALCVIAAIYFMFTASMLSTGRRFGGEDFWLLQFLMLFAALVSVTLVIRALLLRKHDLRTQFGLQQAHHEMQDLLNRDPLTAAWNRRFLENHFRDIVAAHHRNGKDSWFVLFDIDEFKGINDTYGHQEGDRVLRAVVAAFTGLQREDEYMIRLGGDEFALLLCDESPALRLRAAVAAMNGQQGAAQHALRRYPAFSVGYLKIPPAASVRLDEVYRMADEAQYQAKRAGGNRAVQQPDAPAPASEPAHRRSRAAT
jgi:diguanylate cyclase (GGDEF)-like protein